MAARAAGLGDVGESAPEHWEKPFGTPDVHVAISALSPDAARLEAVLAGARKAYEDLSGVSAIWRLECHVLPTEREAFGFKDGISHPAVEGSSIPGTNPQEHPIKAGEFLLGYRDETGDFPPMPQPDVLGRNGTYVAFRKLYQRVAAFRQFVKANATSPGEEELFAAKMMGRWQSGAPLALCPMHDDPELGADPARNNDFLFNADDPTGLKTPPGSHIRRMNPRNSSIIGVPRLHRMIRRGTSYGPLLPARVLEDDGADRGLAFVFVGAHLERQFEFVQSEWVTDGLFFGAPGAKDPNSGPERRDRPVHNPATTDPPAPDWSATVRRDARRGVFLRTGPAGPALAGCFGDVTSLPWGFTLLKGIDDDIECLVRQRRPPCDGVRLGSAASLDNAPLHWRVGEIGRGGRSAGLMERSGVQECRHGLRQPCDEAGLT